METALPSTVYVFEFYMIVIRMETYAATRVSLHQQPTTKGEVVPSPQSIKLQIKNIFDR
jgi:hypothetical protein